VETHYDGDLRYVRWRLRGDGWLRLEYAYHFPGHGQHAYLGVTFDHPEKTVRALRWLGHGPYRVWKNRLKGAELDVWRKAYNRTATGASWDYPELKGFHANVHWATLETSTLPMTMVFATDDIFLRVLTPDEAEDPRTTHVDFPPGDLSFLHGIAPIGTKFHPASAHGPQGASNMVPRLGRTYEATVLFRLGTDQDGHR
jgi:hypothetical protein